MGKSIGEFSEEQIQTACEVIRALDGAKLIPKELFHAIASGLKTTPVEMVPVTGDNRVLMNYRKDSEFTGWHFPGTVIMRNTDSKQEAIKRLRSELKKVGVEISHTIEIGTSDVTKGNGPGENPTRGELAIHFIAFIDNEPDLTKSPLWKLFPINDLPKGTLSHHLGIRDDAQEWLAQNRTRP